MTVLASTLAQQRTETITGLQTYTACSLRGFLHIPFSHLLWTKHSTTQVDGMLGACLVGIWAHTSNVLWQETSSYTLQLLCHWVNLQQVGVIVGLVSKLHHCSKATWFCRRQPWCPAAFTAVISQISRHILEPPQLCFTGRVQTVLQYLLFLWARSLMPYRSDTFSSFTPSMQHLEAWQSWPHFSETSLSWQAAEQAAWSPLWSLLTSDHAHPMTCMLSWCPLSSELVTANPLA